MSTNLTEPKTPPSPPDPEADAHPSVPKKITNAQTVCNEKNEKGKLCNGHLKQLKMGGEAAQQHLRGDDALSRCQTCGTLYIGPPLGHLRDPDKQDRFVERELSAILKAAGGSLPAFRKTEKGAWVPVEDHAHHAAAPAKSVETTPPIKSASGSEKPTSVQSKVPSKPAAQAPAAPAASPFKAKEPVVPARTKGYVPPPAPGPVPGETHEQKLARLGAIVAEAKRRKAAAEAEESGGGGAQDEPVEHTQPTAASTSGTDSSPEADTHRAEAEAQAATGQASAVPMSSAAATAVVMDSNEATPAPTDNPAVAVAKPKPLGASGPVPGETHEQKILRLQQVVNAARIRDGKPPKY